MHRISEPIIKPVYIDETVPQEKIDEIYNEMIFKCYWKPNFKDDGHPKYYGSDCEHDAEEGYLYSLFTKKERKETEYFKEDVLIRNLHFFELTSLPKEEFNFIERIDIKNLALGIQPNLPDEDKDYDRNCVYIFLAEHLPEKILELRIENAIEHPSNLSEVIHIDRGKWLQVISIKNIHINTKYTKCKIELGIPTTVRMLIIDNCDVQDVYFYGDDKRPKLDRLTVTKCDYFNKLQCDERGFYLDYLETDNFIDLKQSTPNELVMFGKRRNVR